MSIVNGDLVLFQIEDPNSLGNYVSLALEKSLSVNFNQENEDVSDKSSAGWTKREPVKRDWSMDIEGALDKGNDVVDFIEDMYHLKTKRNIRVITPVDRYDGLATLSKFNWEAGSGKMGTLSFSLEAADKITRTKF